MRTSRSLLAAAALLVVAAARPAAAHTSIGLGADYLIDPHAGDFQFTLAIDSALTRHISLGARFGAMYLTDPGGFGAPIDGRLRIQGSRLYAEGLLGPWLDFRSGFDTIRLHAAFGFGLVTRKATVGLEVGWLDPTSMIGIRVAFPL